MKIIYEAFDGKQFEDQYDCELHEFNEALKSSTVKVYDCKRHRIKNWYNEEGFNFAHRVIISENKELEDMRKVTNFYGTYCEINSIGTWIYEEEPKDGSWPGWRLRKK